MATSPLSIAAPSQPIPRNLEVRAFLYANAVIGETARFRQLDRYEAHYRMTQYAHLAYDWWGKTADVAETVSPSVQVPLGWTQPMIGLDVRTKRPTAPLNLCKAVVDRFTGLLFSEQRRPQIAVENDPDTEAFLLAVIEQCQMWARLRQARNMGGATGSALITVGLRNGEFALEVHNPKHVTPLWRDRRTLQLEAVLKMYKYAVEEQVIDEKTREAKGVRPVEYLYRRIISAYEDIVFVPVRMENLNGGLTWEVESEVKHDLGFFPGAWVQNLPVLEAVDGDPDCHGGWQMLDTLDRLVSQMNKGVLLNLDPTVVLNYDHREVEAQGGIRKGSDAALALGVQGNAKYLEISGTGIEAGTKTFTLLRQAFLDLVRCVMIDPQTISGSAQSAKAIELIYAPMLEKADDLRAQWGDLCVVPLLRVIEKMARKVSLGGRTADGRQVQTKFILPSRVTEGDDGKPRLTEQTLGPGGGYIKCKWGPYFAPSEQDQKQRIDNAVGAKTGGLIDHLGAIKHTAAIFGIQNPEEVLRKVDDEQQAEAEMMLGGMGEGGVPAEPQTEQRPSGPQPNPQGGGQGPNPPAGQGGRP